MGEELRVVFLIFFFLVRRFCLGCELMSELGFFFFVFFSFRDVCDLFF